MNKNKNILILLFIFLFSISVRLWELGTIPPGLHWDETAFGYNAYSILKTGRDEYGNLFPMILKSFGDYKLAFYAYLAILPEAIFGLNEFAVRLPAAIFGALNIFPLFLITKELFAEFKKRVFVSLLAGFILALSPWNYHYSHGAWEGNVLTFFVLFGIWFFLKALNGDDRFFYLSAFAFGLTFYIYQGAKLLVPLIIFGLFIIFWRKIIQIPRKIIISYLMLLGILALPVFFSIFWGNAGGRLKTMSIFSYPRLDQEAMGIAKEEDGTPGSFEFTIFHGDFNYYLRGIVGRYLNHFSPRFLFFEGDWSNPRHSVPFAGVMNFVDILLLPLGIYFLISQKVKNQALVWYLLLVAPLPAALTRDVVQATRSYFMVFPLTVISAFGVYFLWEKVKTTRGLIKYGLIFGGVTVYLFSVLFYLDQFFVHAPKQYSQDWLYGYKEAVRYVAANKDKYDSVVFTHYYGQPYIYWLFYTRYDPANYQRQARLIENPEGDVGYVEKVDNLFFRGIYWPRDRFTQNILFVGGPYEIPYKDVLPEESKILKEIKFLNGETAFIIAETFYEKPR